MIRKTSTLILAAAVTASTFLGSASASAVEPVYTKTVKDAANDVKPATIDLKKVTLTAHDGDLVFSFKVRDLGKSGQFGALVATDAGVFIVSHDADGNVTVESGKQPDTANTFTDTSDTKPKFEFLWSKASDTVVLRVAQADFAGATYASATPWAVKGDVQDKAKATGKVDFEPASGTDA